MIPFVSLPFLMWLLGNLELAMWLTFVAGIAFLLDDTGYIVKNTPVLILATA